MRAETVIMALKERRKSMQEGVFSKPPSDMDEFRKQQGIWIGLGDAISIITDEAKKEGME